MAGAGYRGQVGLQVLQTGQASIPSCLSRWVWLWARGLIRRCRSATGKAVAGGPYGLQDPRAVPPLLREARPN